MSDVKLPMQALIRRAFPDGTLMLRTTVQRFETQAAAAQALDDPDNTVIALIGATTGEGEDWLRVETGGGRHIGHFPTHDEHPA